MWDILGKKTLTFFTAINLIPTKLMKNISHVNGENSLCPPFRVLIEQLSGEHNFNTGDSKTARAWTWKCFDSTKKEIWKQDSKPFASQLYLDL